LIRDLINYFKNLLTIFQKDYRFFSVTFQQYFHEVSSVKIADTLLLQSYLRNLTDITKLHILQLL